MKIINHRKIYLSIAGILVVASLVVVIVLGFNQGVDFRGGTLWQFEIPEKIPTTTQLEDFFRAKIIIEGDIKVSHDQANNNFFARMPVITESDHQTFTLILKDQYPSFSELSFQSIGPSIGERLKRNAIWAVILSLIGVSIYIAFAFRKTSKPISSWKYGVVTMTTLFHDIVIPAALLALLGRFSIVEIDSNFIVAILVIMGFSVHDTIVVFDRARENLSLDRGKTEFGEVINSSINQTIARSINTSVTLIFVLIALYFVGPINLKYFILVLIVGVSAGVYSSIFVASPLLVVWHNWQFKRENR